MPSIENHPPAFRRPRSTKPPKPRLRRTNAQLEIVDQAIIEAVEAEAPVSLRRVYYRLVSLGLLNKDERAYKTVMRRLVKLRRAGAVDYADVVDGTRSMFAPTTYTDLDEALLTLQQRYRRNFWQDQDVTVMILSEKDAITGVILPVTAELQVPLGIARGYSSETFVWSVARDLAETGKDCVLYNLGDHDPSGVGAWADFVRKVQEMYRDVFGGMHDIVTERLAVTPEQIISLNLLTRPTKAGPHAKGFVGESVEVDAIPAPVLRQLVRDAIERHIDPVARAASDAIEAQERAQVAALTLNEEDE